MKEFIFDSFDDAMHCLLIDMITCPDHICSPRGQKIKECISYSFTLRNPTRRVLVNPERCANYGFGVGEFLWYLTGKRDLETMLYYNKRMKDFSNDGKTLNSAYGYLMFKKVMCVNPRIKRGPSKELILTQWDVVKETLLDDPDSRRAVIVINKAEDQADAIDFGSKDVPCTMHLQFFIRRDTNTDDERLHMHTVMRSNDMIWGLTYDLFSFTLLQEHMLNCLKKYDRFKNLKMGKYHHTAGSMHLYERHFDMARRMLVWYNDNNIMPHDMGKISDRLFDLAKDAELLRNGLIERIDVGNYLDGEKWMATQLNEHRMKRNAEDC